jgi:hypothetical protein
VLKQVQGTQFFFGRICGIEGSQNFPFHIFTLSPPWKRLPFLWSCSKIVSMICFNYHCQRKHLRNIVFLKYCYNHCRLITIVTNGNTYGGMVISQLRRHTIISLVPPTLTQHFGGFGVPPASLNTKYFIGYCSETG